MTDDVKQRLCLHLPSACSLSEIPLHKSSVFSNRVVREFCLFVSSLLISVKGLYMLCVGVHSVVSDSFQPRTVAHEAPLSWGFSRQEH